MTRLESLKKLMPPPVGRAAAHDWNEVETRLGLHLPADYKEFIDSYGTGGVADFLAVLTPFSGNANLNLFDKGEEMLAGYRYMHQSHSREYPFPAFPDEGGVLPWGVTDNGDEIYWLTRGPADAWPSVIWATPEGMYERHDMSLVELIARWIDGKLKSDVLPPDMPAVFAPA